MHNQSQNTLISIIVPIYNTGKYLKKCLDSISQQTYRNFEVLMIDDGSTDNSFTICESYSNNDTRFKTIHKDNEGVSVARNKGIECAKGEYVSFIDSDDYVDTRFIEELVGLALSNDAEIAACAYEKIFNRRSTQKNIDKIATINTYKPIDAVKDILGYNTKIDVVLWNKIYKKKLFTDHNIKFPAGRIMEDSARVHEILFFSNKIVYTDKALYYYIQRKIGNITSSRFNEQLSDALKVIDDQKEFIRAHKLNLKNEMRASELMTSLKMINVLVDQGESTNSNWQTLRSSITKKTKTYLLNPSIHNRQKISILILSSGSISYQIYRKLFISIKQIKYGNRL